MISPSVLPCDFSKLGAEVEALDAAGVDLFQWDVMDGQFVPNLTFGPDLIVHAEACPHLHRTLGNINSMGANAAVALNPHTPISEIEHVLDLVDMVLIMTVNPGFGGQSYIASMEPKIRELKALIDRRGLSEQVNIEVDGGIGPSTIEGAAAAGANVLIAGTALFRYTEGLEFAVKDLRAKATAARAAK